MLEWRSTAGRRTSNTLIPIVGDVRPSMRKITQHSVVKKNLRIGDAKQNTYREREGGTKNMSIFIEMQQLQLRTTNLYKRLLSHFI